MPVGELLEKPTDTTTQAGGSNDEPPKGPRIATGGADDGMYCDRSPNGIHMLQWARDDTLECAYCGEVS